MIIMTSYIGTTVYQTIKGKSLNPNMKNSSWLFLMPIFFSRLIFIMEQENYLAPFARRSIPRGLVESDSNCFQDRK